MLLNALLFFFLSNGYALTADSPVGVWKTIDDETGQPKSHVELYLRNGKLYGKVVRLLQKPADTLCEKCKGDKKDKPVLRMIIVENLTQEDRVWKGGNILDPVSGNTYACSMWLEDGNLRVRGKHWTGLYRTQTWYRLQESNIK
ncbi:MAG: DUF2147 domain-containing protein [Haliscomenobacter sp.]|nr:DUF2147 domain-containing protein [Haliscomenobacter sp.]